MNRYTKKAMIALLFVGTAGAMEQNREVEHNQQPFVAGQNEGVQRDIQRKFKLSDVQLEKTQLAAQIKNLLTADTTLALFVETAIQIETRRQNMKRSLDNGIESHNLVHYFAKSIGQSFSALWNGLFERYFDFLNTLEVQSIKATQGNCLLTRDELLLRFNHAVELNDSLNQLHCASIQPLVERSGNQLALIANNLQ